MSWYHLVNDFSLGKPDAIQAVFSILGFIITVIGIYYVAKSFIQQKKINLSQDVLNQSQAELNRIALEKDRWDILPYFSGEDITTQVIDVPLQRDILYRLILKENKALDVEVFELSPDGKVLSPIYLPSQIVFPGKNFIDLHIRIPEKVMPFSFDKQYLLYFTDLAKRKYTQEVGHNGEKVVVIYSQLIEDDNFRERLPLWQGS